MRSWLYPIVLIAVVLIAFGPLATAEFSAWDDTFNVSHNPRLNPPTWQGVLDYWQKPAFGLYIPVTYTAWSALAVIAYVQTPDPSGTHLNPYVFHTANIVVHAVSSLLVYLIVRKLVANPRAAWLGAMLFALHPVQVEPVGWVAGLKDVLCGALSLLAIHQYMVSTEAPRRGVRYAFATAALLLAMLSKPTAMVVPVMVFAIDWMMLRRSFWVAARWVAPWIVLSVICAIGARLAQPGTGVPSAPIWARPFVVADSLAFYLYKLVWPMNLGIDYGRTPRYILENGAIWFTWILPALIALPLVVFRKRFPLLVTAAIVFVAGVAPVLGLVTFLFQYYSTTADHYLYLSMLGPAIAAAWVIQQIRHRLVVAIALLIAALLGVRTMLQTQVWQNPVAVFSHAIRVNPASFAAHSNLGIAYKNLGELEPAERYLRRAMELKPDLWEAYHALAGLMSMRGEHEQAVALRKQALQILMERPREIRADIAPVLNGLGRDLLEAGRLDEAAVFIDMALKNRPDDPHALSNEALLREMRESAATQSTR